MNTQLRRDDAAAPGAGAAPRGPHPNATPTVLAVDDDTFMRELLSRIFTAAGIAVQTFDSAASLLASADFRPPCALLLDVEMPGMSGPELQIELRQRGVDVPVIFLTARGNVPLAVATMRNGAVDFLEKPIDTEQLVERVRRTLAIREPAVDSPHSLSHAARLDTLTPRERAVFELMVTGQTNKRMARELGGSFRTIEIHRARVMTKMGATSLAELVRMNLTAVVT